MVAGAVFALGSFSGVALANYTTAGMNPFYEHVRVEPQRAVTDDWEIARTIPPDALMPSGYREDSAY